MIIICIYIYICVGVQRYIQYVQYVMSYEMIIFPEVQQGLELGPREGTRELTQHDRGGLLLDS